MAAEPLRVLVTNDDGYAAEGIDTFIQAMVSNFPDAEITVIAPATDMSGKGRQDDRGHPHGDRDGDGERIPRPRRRRVPCGHRDLCARPGRLARPPHLVVSGINWGLNVGPFMGISGTVGAARTAAKRGVPAIASSQQAYDDAAGQAVAADYGVTAAAMVAWIEQNYDNLLSGAMPPVVYSFNGPTCTDGPVRGVIDVPLSVADGQDFGVLPTCGGDPVAPSDDLDAVSKGYIAYSEVDPDTLAAIG